MTRGAIAALVALVGLALVAATTFFFASPTTGAWADVVPYIYGAIAFVFVIAIVIGIVALLRRTGGVGAAGGFAAAGGVLMKIVTISFVMVALFYTLYMMYPDSPLFTTPEGRGHIAFYFILAILAMMVEANLVGKMRVSAFIMLFIIFALIGTRTAMLLDPSGNLFAGLHRGTVATRVAAPICTGRAKVEPIPASPIAVSENDSCPFHFGIVNGIVELAGPTGRRLVRPGEESSVPHNFVTRTARAIAGMPVMSHTSCDIRFNNRYDGQNCL